jgi:hypothetical protein
MSSNVDWELVARLNLHNFLLEVIIAGGYAAAPDGEARLQELRERIVDRMVNRMQISVKLSEEDELRAEAPLQDDDRARLRPDRGAASGDGGYLSA